MTLRVSALLLISSTGAATLPACGNSSERSASHLPPGGGDLDAGGADANAADCRQTVPLAEAGPCNAEGTWRITYDCAVENDLVFVTRDQQGGYRARFAGRRPPHPITPDSLGRSYSVTATFDAATCALSLESNVRWVDSGMGFCGDQRVITLALEMGRGTGTLVRHACGDFSGTCPATAERLAGPGDCPQAAAGNEPCNTGATCDSGCSSPCTCECGLWRCEYPKLGAACLAGEACTLKRSSPGGYDALSCTNAFLNGSLREGGDICGDVAPVDGNFCPSWTGLLCGRCECAAVDGGASVWACFR